MVLPRREGSVEKETNLRARREERGILWRKRLIQNYEIYIAELWIDKCSDVAIVSLSLFFRSS